MCGKSARKWTAHMREQIRKFTFSFHLELTLPGSHKGKWAPFRAANKDLKIWRKLAFWFLWNSLRLAVLLLFFSCRSTARVFKMWKRIFRDFFSSRQSEGKKYFNPNILFAICWHCVKNRKIPFVGFTFRCRWNKKKEERDERKFLQALTRHTLEIPRRAASTREKRRNETKNPSLVFLWSQLNGLTK